MNIRPFVDALPIPRVLRPKSQHKNYSYYEVRIKEFFHKFHTDIPKTRAWGYEGQIPGPTIEAEQGKCVRVKWINDLPEQHFLPIDRTLHSSSEHMPDVRTVVHLHGLEVEPDSDGHPDAWYTKNFEKWGPRFAKEVYEYPKANAQLLFGITTMLLALPA